MAKRFAQKKSFRRYGWVPGTKEPKHFFDVPHMAVLPTHVDLRSNCPAIYDQGNLGSCTANAAAALAQYIMIKQKLGNWMPSRLALYYWNRLQEGTVGWDSGASLYDAMNTMVIYGVPHDSLWPYNIRKFATKPTKNVWSDAYWHSIQKGLAVRQDLNTIKTTLAAGNPIIFGFVVYESFESNTVATTGIMPMPKDGEQTLGGHAVMAVGYNDETQMIIVRNSWGTSWGQSGYFMMPYDFITNPNYCDDFWTATTWVRFKKT